VKNGNSNERTYIKALPQLPEEDYSTEVKEDRDYEN
jgi:hypothetical protein